MDSIIVTDLDENPLNRYEKRLKMKQKIDFLKIKNKPKIIQNRFLKNIK